MSVHYYKMAFEKGCIYSMTNLGLLLESGKGIKKIAVKLIVITNSTFVVTFKCLSLFIYFKTTCRKLKKYYYSFQFGCPPFK